MEKDSVGQQKGKSTAPLNGSQRNLNPGIQKHGEPNREDMERLQRLLDKAKEPEHTKKPDEE